MTGIELLQALLPGGVAVAGTLAYNAWKSYREFKNKDDDKLYQRLQHEADRTAARADRTQRELDFSEQVGDWWRNRAGQLEYVLRRSGIEVPPEPPMPQRSNDGSGNHRAASSQTTPIQ